MFKQVNIHADMLAFVSVFALYFWLMFPSNLLTALERRDTSKHHKSPYDWNLRSIYMFTWFCCRGLCNKKPQINVSSTHPNLFGPLHHYPPPLFTPLSRSPRTACSGMPLRGKNLAAGVQYVTQEGNRGANRGVTGMCFH